MTTEAFDEAQAKFDEALNELDAEARERDEIDAAITEQQKDLEAKIEDSMEKLRDLTK